MASPRTKFDLVGYNEFAAHRHCFVMWPKYWKKFQDPTVLTWDSVPFDASQKKYVPKETGVYAFVITTDKSAGFQSSYLMYIGQTSDQTLRERFGQYLSEVGTLKGRPKLVAHLPRYKGYTYFHFAEVPLGGNLTPETIEHQLLSGFVPPLNSRFKGEIGEFVRAFV